MAAKPTKPERAPSKPDEALRKAHQKHGPIFDGTVTEPKRPLSDADKALQKATEDLRKRAGKRG